MVPDTASQLAQRRLEEQLSITQAEMRGLQEQESAYRRRELRQREVLDGMPCGMIVLDERGRPAFNNTHTRDLFGRELKAGDSVEDWLLQACLDDKHCEEVAKLWRESIWRRQLTKVVSLSTADGLLKDFEFRPSPLPGGGLLVTIHDVTETCRLEEMLRATEAKFRALLHENPQPVVLTDQSGSIFEVNVAAEKLFGLPKAELRRMSIDDWLVPESIEARHAALLDTTAASQPAVSLAVQMKLGSPAAGVPVQLRIATVYDADGRLHSTAHFFEIERVAPPVAPELASPNIATLVMQAAPMAGTVLPEPSVSAPGMMQDVVRWQPLLSTDTQGRIVAWSSHAEQRFGYSEADVLSHSLHRLFRPSDATAFHAELTQHMAAPDISFTWAWFGKSSARGQVALMADQLSGGGLSVRLLVETTVQELVPAPPTPLSLTGLGAATPHQWPPANIEREQLLLTEAHHRIKNHLQIISSLLNLQSNAIEDPEARNALRSSQTRVQAIGGLHQTLFELSNGQAPRFQDFADDLIMRLRECYDVTADRVATAVQIDDCPVLEEWLVPLALILNESVANAFKHAFPNGRNGLIEVLLQRESDHGSLTVRDNGEGLSHDFLANPTGGLGHKILGVFADQMGASISLTNNPGDGTLFHLRFPIGCVDN
jgi:PAS domain S-box-containing protein